MEMDDNQKLPDLPSRETLSQYLGKMLLARGIGLPKHGEPWHLVQVTEPSETGTVNEVPIMAFEVLFLTPERREQAPIFSLMNQTNLLARCIAQLLLVPPKRLV